MDRINTATKALDLFGSGKHGFKDGNLALAIQPTGLEAAFFNDLQEELVGVIEGAGLVPTAGVRTQIRQAIEIMISGSTGNDFKTSVRAATTVAINLAAPGAAIDGVSMVAGDRFLDKDNATPALRGIYIWNGAAVAAIRAVDADGAGEMTAGMQVVVEEGTAQADSIWLLATDGPIVIGTTALQFVRRDSGAANTAQLASGSASVSGNALTVTLDPSTTDFRSATLTSGARTSVNNASAISLTAPNGASLGGINGVAARIAVLEVNNAGVKEVAFVNVAGGLDLDETTLISTTAIGAGSTSANVIYSQTARASVPFRVRMYIDIVPGAAGAWPNNPTKVQPLGGLAGDALGKMQTQQDFTGARAAGTTYYNLTGKDIEVSVEWKSGSNISGYGTVEAVVTQNGVAVKPFTNTLYHSADTQSDYCAPFTVPPGAAYVVNISGTFGPMVRWSEKR